MCESGLRCQAEGVPQLCHVVCTALEPVTQQSFLLGRFFTPAATDRTAGIECMKVHSVRLLCHDKAEVYLFEINFRQEKLPCYLARLWLAINFAIVTAS